MRKNVTGDWIRLHDDDKVHNLYSPPDIISVMKSRKMKRVEHGTCVGKNINKYRVLVEKPESQRSL